MSRTLPFGSLTGAVRAAIEDVYVTVAKGVMRRSEGLEDALAERRHASRVGRSDKTLERQRSSAPQRIGAPARPSSKA